MSFVRKVWRPYRLRLKRRRLLLRALRKKRDLKCLLDQTFSIQPDDILCFATVRNEAHRLPYFLKHHRTMGVAHFLIVDNGSDDGTSEFLKAQPDVSVWTTGKSYRAARFGMDWLNALLMKYGHNHWCLTLDADEALVIPHHETRDLHDLTAWLDAQQSPVFSAMMLDMYSDIPAGQVRYRAGQAFHDALPFYDAHNYSWALQEKYNDISIRGGMRSRVFFTDQPDIAPHLHKTPLIKWHWRYAYVSSTHVVLPTPLNSGFDARLNLPTGALLHSKFLPEFVAKASQEFGMQEYHYSPEQYDSYYVSVAKDPILWAEGACQYRGSLGLEEDGILTRGAWS